MPQEEKTHNRPQEFSYWHRPPSLSRFLEPGKAKKCYLSDLDSILYVEWYKDHKPLCLFEVAKDIGQSIESKNAKLLMNLSKNTLNAFPVFVVLYELADSEIPNMGICVKDIESFNIRQVAPARPEPSHSKPLKHRGNLPLAGCLQEPIFPLR